MPVVLLLVELVPGLPLVPVALVPDVPCVLFCAIASELESASAAAKPIAASFMLLSFSVEQGTTTFPPRRSWESSRCCRASSCSGAIGDDEVSWARANTPQLRIISAICRKVRIVPHGLSSQIGRQCKGTSVPSVGKTVTEVSGELQIGSRSLHGACFGDSIICALRCKSTLRSTSAFSPGLC